MNINLPKPRISATVKVIKTNNKKEQKEDKENGVDRCNNKTDSDKEGS